MKSMTKSAIAVCVFSVLFANTVKASALPDVSSVNGSFFDESSVASGSAEDRTLGANINSMWDMVRPAVNDNDARITSTDNKLSALDKDYQSTKLGVVALDQKVTTIDQNVSSATAYMYQQDSKIAAAQSTADTAIAGVKNVATTANNAQTAADNAVKAVQNHETRIAALENAPTPLQGAKGDQGIQGVQGIQGLKGDVGATGAQGLQGVAGVNGKDGVDGKNGKDGAQGKQGIAGVNGKDGKDGKDGVNGKNGTNGKDGKNGVTTTTVKHEVDKASQAAIASNSQQLKAVRTQTNAQAQDLNAAKQFFATQTQSNNSRLSSIEERQNQDRKEYRAGIAGAASIAGLHYVDTNNAVAIGAANFKDQQGYAMGYRHKFSDNAAATLAASGTSNGDSVVAVSASVGW